MKILLAAEEAAGLQILRRLLSGSDEVVGVLTSHAETATGAAVWNVAEKAGIAVWPSELIADPEFASTVSPFDILLNVHSLFRIDPRLLERPGIGSFNLHPGPLPRFCGLNAPSWAVYLGEKDYAVTLHWITEKIDAGPIVFESRFEIGNSDTGLSVSTKCVRDGVPLIERMLQIARTAPDQIPRRPQPVHGRRVFLRNSVPLGGRIDWNREAAEVARLIRACDYYPLKSPWGQAWTTIDGARLHLADAQEHGMSFPAAPGQIVKVDDAGVWVSASTGAVVLRKLLVEGRPTPASKVLDIGKRLN